MVEVDYSCDLLLTDFGIQTLKDRYLLPEEKSPQDAFARAAQAFSDDINHAQRIYDYVSRLWFMFSTPILSNGGTNRGLPISCFLSTVGDDRKSITDHWSENMFLASVGGGIGTNWSALRSNGVSTSKGSRSNGIIPFIKVVDSEIIAVSQGNTRRGSYAAYLDINHPEIEEFIIIRKSTGGDANRRCLNIHHAVNISDAFMEAVERGDSWSLIDPHSKQITKTVPARELWRLILETRVATGEPYLHFIDTANRALPECQKEKGLRINGSNLCQEIELVTSEDRTAVCCLSSVNLAKFDEWRDNDDFIPDLIRFLDNVLTSFISSAPPELWRAKYSASQERSLGLGAMGFHTYLQSHNIPFESALAVGINKKIFRHIKDQAVQATQELTQERGPCPDSKNSSNPVRNLHLLAIAPNASSSILCGNVSPSIEPFRANAFTQKTLTGSALAKNKILEQVLDKKEKNTEETWTSILANDGSVQHLDFLTAWEKDVFKTAIELDQFWIIQHAADRAEFICQNQSLNLFFPANTHVKYLHEVHMDAWKKGLKGLYYLRSASLQRPDLISKQIERLSRMESEECLACSG